jgi:hypothetical protein
MASRGEQGLVAGVPLSCIPSGEAYIWGYNVPLEAMQKHSVNLAQSGIHCIVIPPDSSLKRHLQSESKSSQKRQKESQLPASTSNETAIADCVYSSGTLLFTSNIFNLSGHS